MRKTDEVDHRDALATERRELLQVRHAFADDHHLGTGDHLRERRAHQAADVRQVFFDVGAVAAEHLADRHVGVEDGELDALADQPFGQTDERALAQIVAAGFEAEAEQRHAARPLFEHDGVDHPLDVRVVARQHVAEQRDVDVELPGDVRHGAKVLGQAGPAETESRLQILRRDVEDAVLAHHLHHATAVDAGFRAERADLVGEADLDGVVHVARVLHHRRFVRLHLVHRCVEVGVGGEHAIGGAAIAGADDGERRMLEVADGAAFAQELGVDGDVNRVAAAAAARRFEPRREHRREHSRQQRAPDRDDVVGRPSGERAADAIDDALEIYGFEASVAATRRADADHGQVSGFQRLAGIVGHPQTAGLDDAAQEVVQLRLGDRRAPTPDQPQLVRVDVDADDLVPGRGQAGRRHRSDIPEPEDRNSHVTSASANGRP